MCGDSPADALGGATSGGPAFGTLCGDERVRRIDLRWGLYAYLLQDGTELVPELACGILRLPHVDNAEAALSLSGDVSQKSSDGPVRRGVDALAISELSHRFLVALPRQTCSLMNEYDRHGYLLLGRSERRKTMTALGAMQLCCVGTEWETRRLGRAARAVCPTSSEIRLCERRVGHRPGMMTEDRS